MKVAHLAVEHLGVAEPVQQSRRRRAARLPPQVCRSSNPPVRGDRLLTARPPPALPRPHALGAVHPGLPHPRRRPRTSTLHPADPERRWTARVMPIGVLQGEAGTGRSTRSTCAYEADADHGRRATPSTRTGRRSIAHLNGRARSRSWRSRTTTGSAPRATSIPRCGATARTRSPASRTCSGTAFAGQIACLGDLAIFVAPVVNSYKRFAAGSWAPTTLAWRYDNRTCGLPARRARPRRAAPSRASRAPT